MISGSSLERLATAAVTGSCVLGVLLLAVAWRDYQARSDFLEHAWPTRAEIVALEPVDSDLSRSNPVASFTTIQGEPVRVALPGLDLSPGDSVSLLYDEELPETVWVNDAWSLWLEPCVLAIAGALLAIVPLLALIGRGKPGAASPQRAPEGERNS